MHNLILVRHSISQPDPVRPPHEWPLTSTGRQRCLTLSEKLAPLQPELFVTSIEPKARMTGELTAALMIKPVKTVPGLHEHSRHTAPWFDNPADFEDAMQTFFNQPDELVFGDETADHCFDRFDRAVRNVVKQYSDQTVAIVTHGTVMALFIAHYNDMDPFQIWQDFEMPSFVVLSLPDFGVVDIINHVSMIA